MKTNRYFLAFFLIFLLAIGTGCNSQKLDNHQGDLPKSSPGGPGIENIIKPAQDQPPQNQVTDKGDGKNPQDRKSGSEDGSNDVPVSPQPSAAKVDYAGLKVNEAGQVVIVMFHNFVEDFVPTKWDNGEYTTTFRDFERLLETLYGKGYRLISIKDFLNNRIDVPAGYTPMVFTFDDGSKGQFSLVEENGRLVADRKSAVGIMEEFYKRHPDFGLKGTFYVNLGLETFDGKGSLRERLAYLTDRGFEIGNHTYSHVDLGAASADKLQEELGANVKKMSDLMNGYTLSTLALPYGIVSEEHPGLLAKGRYGETEYENKGILLVGANPSYSPAHPDFNPLKLPRVRAQGIKPVDADLIWWLEVIDESPGMRYISDGDPEVVSVAADKADQIDEAKLNGKRLNRY